MFFVIGIINLFIGFLGTMIGFYNLINNKPILIINDDGIEHKKITEKPIPWNIIQKARLINLKNRKFISIRKIDNSKYDNFKLLFKKTSFLSHENSTINLDISQLNVDEKIIIKYLNEKKKTLVNSGFE